MSALRARLGVDACASSERLRLRGCAPSDLPRRDGFACGFGCVATLGVSIAAALPRSSVWSLLIAGESVLGKGTVVGSTEGIGITTGGTGTSTGDVGISTEGDGVSTEDVVT